METQERALIEFWEDWKARIEMLYLREEEEKWETIDPRTLEGDEWIEYRYDDCDPWDEICEWVKEFKKREK